MSRLIGDLLDIVSMEAGKFTVLPEDQDVAAVVDDFVESFGPSASAKGISLAVIRPRQPLAARFDRHRIQQVLGNLLVNALRYTPAGGKISVCVESEGDEARVSVVDTGCGIAADRLGSIFERFSRGARPAGKGLGLGLYIARRIIQAQGGRIWVESQPGSGSSFRFTLPLSPAAMRRSTAPRPARTARR